MGTRTTMPAHLLWSNTLTASESSLNLWQYPYAQLLDMHAQATSGGGIYSHWPHQRWLHQQHNTHTASDLLTF
jgi:hypothetical protein